MNRLRLFAQALSVSMMCTLASAHGPTPHRITQVVDIAAPPRTVWKIVGNFAGMTAWHPMVAECTADNGNKVDSQRHLTLKNGAQLIDSMDFYDPKQMTYTYRLMNQDIQQFAVSFYSATVTVKPQGGGTQVEWVGNFYRADTQNEPAENLNDEAAEKVMTEFFHSGLQGLKQAAEH